MASSLEDRLKQIEERISVLESRVLSREKRDLDISVGSPVGLSDLLALPDSLRKTMMAIQDLGEASAQKVAESSGRTRSIETIYLNQLVRMGYLTRERKGRKIFFKPIRYY